MHYESGVLAQTLEDRQNSVMPVLVGFESKSDLVGPWVNYQAVMFDEEGIRKVFQAVGKVVAMQPDRALDKFVHHWADLEGKYRTTVELHPSTPPKKRSPGDILDEILGRLRSLEVASSESNELMFLLRRHLDLESRRRHGRDGASDYSVFEKDARPRPLRSIREKADAGLSILRRVVGRGILGSEFEDGTLHIGVDTEESQKTVQSYWNDKVPTSITAEVGLRVFVLEDPTDNEIDRPPF